MLVETIAEEHPHPNQKRSSKKERKKSVPLVHFVLSDM
jgi:hypothetical protein